MATQKRLAADSPLVATATAADFKPILMRLGLSSGHVIHRERADVLAEDLARGVWTLAELELAAALIPIDAELMKEINFSRTINTGVFAMARQRPEVQRGRLFTFHEAVEYARRHYRPQGDETERSGVGALFEVVRVEGILGDDGALQPFWMLKS